MHKIIELKCKGYPDRDNALKILQDYCKDIKMLDRQAENVIILKLIENCWDQLKDYDKIEYAKQGFDIIISGKNKQPINIEVKASNKKTDYFNQNYTKINQNYIKKINKKYVSEKPPDLWGNTLKGKDIHTNETDKNEKGEVGLGLLKADFLIFAAKLDTSQSDALKKLLDDALKELRDNSPSDAFKKLNDTFSCWIFTKDELSQLYPRAQLFTPSHVDSIMIEQKKSHFTDEFHMYKKGVYAIILPLYDKKNKLWTTDYPDPPKSVKLHSFLDTWCPLLDQENKALHELTSSKIQNKNICNWKLLFTYQNKITKNVNFKHHECYFYSQQEENIPPECKPKCAVCRETVKKIINIYYLL